jgi:hypothetical protein
MKILCLQNDLPNFFVITKNLIKIVLTLISFTSIVFAQKHSIKPVPKWVVLKDSVIKSEVDYVDINSGFYYMNYNNIYNHIYKSDFIRTKVKLVTTSGVEAMSQINIAFDTSYQKVEFHYCKIIRDSKTIDRTNQIKFNLINNENNLGSNVISGIMSLHAVLDDIRRSDELEIAYSIIGSNPIHGNHFNTRLFLEDINHIDHLSILLITNKNLKYQFRVVNKDGLKISEYSNDAENFLEINSYSIKPIDLSRHGSPSYIPYNYIEVSSFYSWADVDTWGLSLFEKDSSPKITEAYKLITKDEDSIVEKATSILDYVQNSIRYTSVNGGIGSYKASLPSLVLERNYGDCKDKSWLLIQLLSRIGFSEVYPFLVNSFAGKNINEYLPGYIHFDHVIVKCIVGNDTLWLDPSLNLQGGNFLNRISYDYGYGLEVGNNSKNVEKMKVDEEYSKTEIVEYFNFENLDGNGTLEVFSTFTGKNADRIRIQFDQMSQKDIEIGFKEIYSKIFTDVRSSKRLEIKDEYKINKITLKESYVIGKPWKAYNNNGINGLMIIYEPIGVYNYLVPASCDSISSPLDLDKFSKYYQITNFKLPDGAVYLLNNFETKNNVYFFKKEQKIKNTRESEIIYNYKSLSDSILPKDFVSICEKVNQDSRNLVLNIFYAK